MTRILYIPEGRYILFRSPCYNQNWILQPIYEKSNYYIQHETKIKNYLTTFCEPSELFQSGTKKYNELPVDVLLNINEFEVIYDDN